MPAEELASEPGASGEAAAEFALGRGGAMRSRVQNLVAAALIAAIMAALGPLAVTAGTVPITLQIFPVVLAALLLSARWAAVAMGVYLVLGAIGIPVYSHGTAGLGVLLGPTGGYIVGFVLGAFVGALTRRAVAMAFKRTVADVAASVATVAAVYLVGWTWLALGPTHLPLIAAFVGGVAPFLVPDMIKGAVAIIVATAVRRATSA
jgi:biotin transport system substrate-specific component